MIIECPSCLTRYDTPAQIPDEGRNVRCAKCAHVWLVKPDDVPTGPDPLAGRQKDDAEAEQTAEPAAVEAEETSEETEVAAAGDDDASSQDETSAEDDAASRPDEPAGGAAAAGSAPDEDQDQADPGEAGEPAITDWLESDDIDWGDDDDSEIAFAEDAPESDDSEAPEAEPEAAPELAPAASAPEAAPDLAEEADEPHSEAPPIVIPNEQPPAPPADRRLMAGWAGFAVFVLLTATLIVTQRVGIVSALPGAASLYQSVGLAVNVRGLDFAKVTSTWTVEAGRSILEIHGDIVNVTDDRITVPTVVFALRNEKGLEVYQWAAEVSEKPLEGGERAPFVARIPTPPKSIRSVQVKFAKSR